MKSFRDLRIDYLRARRAKAIKHRDGFEYTAELEIRLAHQHDICSAEKREHIDNADQCFAIAKSCQSDVEKYEARLLKLGVDVEEEELNKQL